jgi:DNA-binding response OmpR family regulator
LVLILGTNPYPAAWRDDVNLVGAEVSSPNLPFSPRQPCSYGTLGMAELVLVVEDEAHVRELVSYTLQGAGYRVVAVDDGESAMREVSQTVPNLIVLDVRLPGIDGWEVCRRIRDQSSVPILILTALTEDESLVRGLRLGADDYLGKPFSPVVLAARVQALLRRAGNATLQQRILLRGLSIDLTSAEVRRDDQPVHLTPTEFRLLASLARRPGQVIGPSELMRLAQGYEVPEREAQEIVKVHVRHLRHKIEPRIEQPRYVLTVRGMGYMLNRDELEGASS